MDEFQREPAEPGAELTHSAATSFSPRDGITKPRHEMLSDSTHRKEHRARELRALAHCLKGAVPIAAVIGETVQLKRSGHLLIAFCPFHRDGTPSFTVYPNHFHCF